MNAVEADAQRLDVQARAFSDLHEAQPTNVFISNIQAEIVMMSAGGRQWPVTCVTSAEPLAWVVSPLTTYGPYAFEESERLTPPWARPGLRALTTWAADRMLQTGLHCVVTVNNWLVSTNLYPEFDDKLPRAIRDHCVARWPGRSIWLRSLNVVQHGSWLRGLRAAGFDLIPTRQVYLFDGLPGNQHANLRRDLALLRKTPSRLVEHDQFQPRDFDRSEQLYAQLYLQKYSTLNPAYTASFIRSWHARGLLRMSGWRDEEGTLQAVLGVFSQCGVSTAPLVGYNTSLPQSFGLYRWLMARAFSDAMERGTVLNLSAGAASFKRLRGGRPAIEYSAAYSGHLEGPARRTLWLLRAATSGIGVPLMKWRKL